MPDPRTTPTTSLFSSLRERLCSRTYTDACDGFGDMDFTDYPPFATCDYCGWDAPLTASTWAEAERHRWRHPDVWCWLRSHWLDSWAYWRLHRGA